MNSPARKFTRPALTLGCALGVAGMVAVIVSLFVSNGSALPWLLRAAGMGALFVGGAFLFFGWIVRAANDGPANKKIVSFHPWDDHL